VNSDLQTLSRTEGRILELLSEGETFGLDLVQKAGGKLKRGSVYVTLARMEEKGYVESRTEAPSPGAIGLPQRLYRPTPFGLRVLDASTLAALAFANRMTQEG
jgi:PadR family transcriptional regulator, regulatory protein PadR